MANTPSFTLSFLDLLLSGLGGVALLVFVFAAIRKNREADVASLARSDLTLECSAPQWRVGQEIGCAVEFPQQHITVRFGDNRDSPPLIHWPEAIAPVVRVRIQGTKGEPCILHAWIATRPLAVRADPTVRAQWSTHDPIDMTLRPNTGYLASSRFTL